MAVSVDNTGGGGGLTTKSSGFIGKGNVLTLSNSSKGILLSVFELFLC